jgi:hypothetical protein
MAPHVAAFLQADEQASGRADAEARQYAVVE